MASKALPTESSGIKYCSLLTALTMMGLVFGFVAAMVSIALLVGRGVKLAATMAALPALLGAFFRHKSK